ncbi:TonB-dependent receptor [Plastoroseomonas hellenica]|uniref:TonB-dependent receptor n=1 Tax=Plastoroseomonas hellenica TaxID=2687306 RepID=UPI001BA5E761|nr:TonB-dependent receptor [Plastoroseomonas hellenica]
MTRTNTLRTAVSHSALGASLAVGFAVGIETPAAAQTAATPEGGSVNLPAIDVEGRAPDNTLRSGTGLGRLQGPIQSLPQTIQVIPQEVLRQQNVTTLEQALRNVPGITSSIGEGNGGVNGDQLRIRGFTAQNDLYIDGLRDFGTYRRDAFTFEEVQALLGPSGVTFGAGSAGGAVNVNSRVPFLGNAYNAVVTGGMGPFARGTLDLNQRLGETTAMRLNLMGQTGSIVGRNLDSGDRWGIAPSIAFGLGTNTTFTLEYLHYHYNEATDGGIPVLTPPGASVGRPITEYGVGRGTWYGTPIDRDRSTIDRLTARLQHRATDWLTLYNDTRFGYQERFFSYTIPSCGNTGATDCTARFFNRNSTPLYSYSGAGSPYESTTWGVQNVTTAVARFNTGSVRHEATLGVDAWYEDYERIGYAYGTDRTNFRGNLLAPNNDAIFGYTRSTANNATRRAQTTAVGVFASDRIWFTPEISILGGVRWSRFQTDYQQFGPGFPQTEFNADNSFWDPRAAIIWEPTPNATFYASYAQASFAPGSNFTTQPGQANANNGLLEPERNTIYEVGARVNVLEGRLGLSAALYQIEKNNATETDPVSGSTFSSGDQQRVRGLDLGATGRITDAWLINARYSYMDSETTSSLTPANIGRRVAFVPRHSASLWTSYEFNRGQPWNVTLGGGVTWSSSQFLNPANTAEVPQNFSLDALISHRINDNLQVSINGYNLTDHRNYTQLWTNRAVLGAGRTVLVSLAASF